MFVNIIKRIARSLLNLLASETNTTEDTNNTNDSPKRSSNDSPKRSSNDSLNEGIPDLSGGDSKNDKSLIAHDSHNHLKRKKSKKNIESESGSSIETIDDNKDFLICDDFEKLLK